MGIIEKIWISRRYCEVPQLTTDIKRYESVLSIFLLLLVTSGNSLW